MIRTNESGKLMFYVMEPEEEMASIRFREQHKPSVIPSYWKDYTVTLKEQAKQLGLKGGYERRFVNILWEEMKHEQNNNHATD